MLLHVIIWLLVWNWDTVAAQNFQIEDIPIEHYTHEDHQNDEIDVELMPRSPRLYVEKDPPEFGFHENRRIQKYFEELAKSGVKSRSKRDIPHKNPTKLVEKLGQPLELLPIDAKNTSELLTNQSSTKQESVGKLLNEHFLINDFIRFRRAVTPKNNADQRLQPDSFIQANPVGTIGNSKKFTDVSNERKDITRETRGTTNEQWIKQPYPVQRDETVFDENPQLPSDPVRAPRVHFVTNEMQERDPLEYKFDRQPRSRSLNKYSPSDLSAEMDYYQPRFARNYVPRERYYERYTNGPRNTYRDDYPEINRSYDPENNGNRKRRIIYYATLPDIPRNSRDDDFRQPADRYAYRDRYDDRYPPPDRYDIYRRRFNQEPRYEADRARDPAYPVKVSTDVKVNDVKKNPERRVYSDVDRTRYNPN